MATFNPQCITFSQMRMIFNARFYYRRLSTLTRAYLLSRYYGIGTEQSLFTRFYIESLGIGDMMWIVFGHQASEQFSQLVSMYPIAFNQLITAQLTGDTEAVRENVDRLYENVAESAAFLENLNPYWNAAEFVALFNDYIHFSIETANAIAAGDTAGEIALYELLNEQTDRMGDLFARGVYAYMTAGVPDSAPIPPSQGGVPCITIEQMNDIYTIRMFWFELATWVRIYMVSRYTGTGNAEQAFAELKQIVANYVATQKKLFPNIDADYFSGLLNEYLDLIAAFVTANMENNAEELNRITMSLYDNADKRSAFIASINPFWDFNQAKNNLDLNTHSTIDESQTFLTKEYEKNIEIFTTILDQAETASTFLSQGLFQYITQPQQMQ